MLIMILFAVYYSVSIIIMHLRTLWSHQYQSTQGNTVIMMMTCTEESLKERLLSVAKIFFSSMSMKWNSFPFRNNGFIFLRLLPKEVETEISVEFQKNDHQHTNFLIPTNNIIKTGQKGKVLSFHQHRFTDTQLIVLTSCTENFLILTWCIYAVCIWP